MDGELGESVAGLDKRSPDDDGQKAAPPDCLKRVRRELAAVRVALLRFEREEGTFEVVAGTGRQFLALGVRLPIAASTLAVAVSEGRRVLLSAEHRSRPLDRIAASLGLRSRLGTPLTVEGTTVGALVVLWDVDRPPVDDPWTAVTGDERELLSILLAPSPNAPRVLVCHEDRLDAAGLAHVVEQRLGATSDVACTLADALDAATAQPPELIVLSDHLSPTERLPETARRLRAAGAAAPLLVLARYDNDLAIDGALRAGASGYLPTAAAAQHLPETATTLLNGRSALRQPGTAPPARLTHRERDVLLGFERGLSDKQIANELGVAISTVKTHARGIYAKLDAASRTAALHKARLTGLI